MSDRVITVKPSGGDYTTLSGAITALSSYKNLDSNNGSGSAGKVTIDCYNLGTGIEDTTGVDFGAGWTTSATNYITIEGAVSERVWADTGKWSTNRYRLVPAANTCGIKNLPNYTRIKDLQVKVTRNGSETAGVIGLNGEGSDNVKIERCIIVGIDSGTNVTYKPAGIVVEKNATVSNCLVYGFASGGESNHYAFSGSNSPGETIEFINCTAVDSYGGFACWGTGTVNYINCGTTGHTTGFYQGNQTTCKTNAPTFVDAAGKDYHLASTDTNWLAQGTTYFSGTICDVDMQTRPATGWDVGFDQYWAPGTRTVPVGPSKAYATLKDAQAGEVALFPALSTNNGTGTSASPSAGILKFECYAMEESLSALLDITGWTTTSSYYVVIQGAASDKTSSNTGIWSTDRYRIKSATNTTCIRNSQAYTRLVDLQVDLVINGNNTAAALAVNCNNHSRVERCIVRCTINAGASNSQEYRGIYGGSGTYTITIINCLVYGFARSGDTNKGRGIYCNTNNTMNIYNTTVVGCYTGLMRSAGTMATYNTGVTGCTAATSGTVSPAPTGGSPVFKNAGALDYHLDSTDTVWKDQGTDQSAAGYSDDIDGNARGATWDIGFSEYTVVIVNKSLSVDSGTYTVSNPSQTVFNRSGKVLIPDLVAIAVNGNATPTTFNKVKRLVPDLITIVITGDSSISLVEYHTDPVSHAYSVTLTDAYIVKRYGALAPDSGSYAVNAPDDSNTLSARKFVPPAGAYTFAGQAAGISAPTGRTLLAETTSIVLTATTLVIDIKMPTELAAYAIDWRPAFLTKSTIFKLIPDSGAYNFLNQILPTLTKAAHYRFITDSGVYSLSGTDTSGIRISYIVRPDSGVIIVAMNYDGQTHWSNEPKARRQSLKASYVWLLD